MTIIQGLGGPKVNPKGASDGQLVNIPARLLNRTEMTESSIRILLLDLGRRVKEKSKINRNLFLRKRKFRRALFLEKFQLRFQ